MYEKKIFAKLKINSDYNSKIFKKINQFLTFSAENVVGINKKFK